MVSMVSDEKSETFLIVSLSFSSSRFQEGFFFFFCFQQFNKNMSGCEFIVFYPVWSLLDVLNIV